MLKNRIAKLERLRLQSDRPLWQVLRPGGGAGVRYPSGRIVEVNQPMEGVKTYGHGFSPDDWDEVTNGG